MTDILLLLVGAILVNNLVLTQLLGVSSFMRGSGNMELAIGMATITTVVLLLSSLSNWLLYHLLLQPLALEFLALVVYILVIAVVVSLAGLVLKQRAPLWYRRLNPVWPLILTNCAVLGVVLINANLAHDLVASLFYSVGAATGFSLAIIVFAALRERIAVSDVPEPLRGSAIAVITAGLMSLAFMGFAGLV